MGFEVYQSVSEDPNSWGEAGEKWDLLPPTVTGGEIVPFKTVKLSFDSEPVQALISVYNSEKWQKAAMEHGEGVVFNVQRYLRGLGITFKRYYSDKEGKHLKRVELDDNGRESVCTWRIEVALTEPDRLLRLAPLDLSFPNPIYSAKALEKYARAEITDLVSRGVIVKTEVEK